MTHVRLTELKIYRQGQYISRKARTDLIHQPVKSNARSSMLCVDQDVHSGATTMPQMWQFVRRTVHTLMATIHPMLTATTWNI